MSSNTANIINLLATDLFDNKSVVPPKVFLSQVIIDNLKEDWGIPKSQEITYIGTEIMDLKICHTEDSIIRVE